MDKNGNPVPDQVIVPVVPGEMTIAGGFGKWGTPTTGILEKDGGLRGWDGRVASVITSPSERKTSFGRDNVGTKRNARGATGDSGGGTYVLGADSRGGVVVGGLVGISDSATTYIAEEGATFFTYFYHIKSWIDENAKATIAPPTVEPVLESFLTGGGGITVSWDERARGWTLQKTGNLQDWENAGTAISVPGSYTYSGNENRQFFRLKKP